MSSLQLSQGCRESRLTVLHPVQAGASTAVGASTAPAPLPAAKQEDEAQVPPQQRPTQLSPRPQEVSPNPLECSNPQQMAPAPDQCVQGQQLLQVKLQLPGMAARAVAVIRGPEESALCLRQLFDTFADRLPSWRALSRKAGWGERPDRSCIKAWSDCCSSLSKTERKHLSAEMLVSPPCRGRPEMGDC